MTEIEDELKIDEIDRTEKQVTAAGVCAAHYHLGPAELD